MIWVACNYKNGHILSVNVIRKLVLLSLFNYQVDEYMKSVVARIADFRMPMPEPLLRRACNEGVILATLAAEAMTHYRDSVKKRKANGGKANNFQNGLPEQSAVAQSFELLSRFIQHVAQHWSVLPSPP